MATDRHLATYGSLAPGQPNYHMLSGLSGTWMRGRVKGRLVARGWGAAIGFPALDVTAEGDRIDVQLFVSDDLPDHWQRLDAFEGIDYRRRRITVETDDGPLEAWIYVDAESADG